jgi:serine/threonine protein kinase
MMEVSFQFRSTHNVTSRKICLLLIISLYQFQQLMDCDLHQIIQSKQSLSDMHHKCFAKQMLEGIKAMHDIGVFRKFNIICNAVQNLQTVERYDN